jgi:hypothetical protein
MRQMKGDEAAAEAEAAAAESHDARRVRQINSQLHYELHPWRRRASDSDSDGDCHSDDQLSESDVAFLGTLFE